jgi:ubiquinone/menaquinone biosynthesis C-methylase UbiE
MRTTPEAHILPALRLDALTRFYDPVMKHLLREQTFKSHLVEQVGPRPGQRVLDLGCGTATLTLMLKEACPEAQVVGLDADEKALALAVPKIVASGLSVELYKGTSVAPPFPARAFDRVVSSLLFHHLSTNDKRRTLAKVRELLRPGGELHVADWGPAQNPLMRVAFLGVQLLDGFATTADNARGLLVPMMEEAGFSDVEETRQFATTFGTIALYRAVA